MDVKKAVGIWIRVSTEEQAQGESPQHHEHRGRAYAEARGWEVREVYHLEGVSGKAVMHHPEAKRMLKDVKDGHITGLIFSKLARLARSTKELLGFSDFFQEHHADLMSLEEAIDTSTPAGRLFYTIIAAMAQWEREEIASRVAASVTIRAKLGKRIGGPAPYGYKWIKEGKAHHFVIDEKEAPVRKLMYELFLKYKRKQTVAKELNRLSYRTRAGALFTETTIERLLRDPAAKGMRRACYTETNDRKKWLLKPREQWILIACPAIVSEEVWDECIRYLDLNKRNRKKPGRNSQYLLAGLVACTCGKKMYVYHKNPLYSCKQCKNRVSVASMDDIYYERLKKFLLVDMDVAKFATQSATLMQEKEALIALAKEEAKTLRQQMDELVAMRINKELTPERFTSHYKPLEERLAGFEQQIPEFEAELDTLRVQHLSADTVLHEAKKLYENWPTMPFEEKRNIVEIITERIAVGTEKITFKLRFRPLTPPTSGKAGNNPQGESASLC
ncbi:recombinase family protein [Niastella populi]|uniref:Recombinase family protein n=1 Tax=Niastella populi TaxID=550983 RepID=A0A1V9EUJ4_9BACT|nr:recombinase family protein [Niastella populi]OQP49837.1 hypothetical protein A4R26_30390 [Niastella populi]